MVFCEEVGECWSNDCHYVNLRLQRVLNFNLITENSGIFDTQRRRLLFTEVFFPLECRGFDS